LIIISGRVNWTLCACVRNGSIDFMGYWQ
jgi:hypothetical protein